VNSRIAWEVTQRDIPDLVGSLERYFAARKTGDLTPPP
jgi:hypothetical protein